MLSLFTSHINQMTITELRKSFQTQPPGQNRYFKNRFSYGVKNSDCNSIALENDTTLSSDTPEGWENIQRNLGKIENWSHGKPMMFNKAKCWCCSWIRARTDPEQPG